jgi:hypothetical protein
MAYNRKYRKRKRKYKDKNIEEKLRQMESRSLKYMQKRR